MQLSTTSSTSKNIPSKDLFNISPLLLLLLLLHRRRLLLLSQTSTVMPANIWKFSDTKQFNHLALGLRPSYLYLVDMINKSEIRLELNRQFIWCWLCLSQRRGLFWFRWVPINKKRDGPLFIWLRIPETCVINDGPENGRIDEISSLPVAYWTILQGDLPSSWLWITSIFIPCWFSTVSRSNKPKNQIIVIMIIIKGIAVM